MRILNEYGVNKGDGSMDTKMYREIACASGEKASIETGKLADGSKLTETDTGKEYVFSEQNSAWTEKSSGSGGGGGESSMIIAHGTVEALPTPGGEDSVPVTLDKSPEEIKAAGANSALVISYTSLMDNSETIRNYYLTPSYSMVIDPNVDVMIYSSSIVDGQYVVVTISKNPEISEYEASMFIATLGA